MNNTRLACLMSALPTLCAAQNTWIVDATGAGQFTEIAAAHDAASPGDTLFVRPGTYQGFDRQTAKGIRIMGSAPGVVIDGPLRLRNIPQGQQLALLHLSVDAFNNGSAGGIAMQIGLLIENCSNLVLSDLTARGVHPGYFPTAAGSQGIWLDQVTGVASRVTAVGGDGVNGSGAPGGAALVINNSRLSMSSCVLQAGNSGVNPSPPGTATADAALICSQSSTVIVDEGIILGGSPGSIGLMSAGSRVLAARHASPAMFAILLPPGTIEHEAALMPWPTSSPLTSRPQPGLTGPATVQRGNTATWTVLGGAGQVFATSMSLGIMPTQLPSLFDGTLFPAAHPTCVFGAGIVGGSSSATMSLAVPNLPALEGLQVYVQVGGWLGQPTLKASGVAVTTIR